MPRVLIIKTSSLGDVIHNLPIVQDLHQAVPGLTIDWLVEEAYVDLLRLHPGLAQIIPVALRRWRKDLGGAATSAERARFRTALRAEAYDVVLDTQGLIKSALMARSARLAPGGERVGYSFRSARESLASLFYDRRYSIDERSHAVERLRSLAAQAFGYPLQKALDFGLQVPPRHFAWLPAGLDTAVARPYAVLLHATSRAEKSWPEADWIGLAQQLDQAGITAVFPWGNEAERVQAQAYVNAAAGCVAPRLTLSAMAALLAGAVCVVGVDTGLTHLAAALERPTVGLFGATPRWRYAPYWTPRAINLGSTENGHGVQPTRSEVLTALTQLDVLKGGLPSIQPAAP
jgi:heptosyltransferase-1